MPKPKEVEHWNEVHRRKDAKDKPSFYWNVSANEYDVRFFRNHNVKSILDIGCASGDEALFLVKNGFDVKGIDISPVAITNANEADKREDGPHFTVADARKLPFGDESFHGVYSVGVLEHTREDIDKSLKEVYRVLKPGGVARLSFKLKFGDVSFIPKGKLLGIIRQLGFEHVTAPWSKTFERGKGEMPMLFLRVKKPE